MTLNPGTGNQTSINANQLYPRAYVGRAGSVGNYTSIYGGNATFSTSGMAAQTRLSTEASPVGEAYRVATNTMHLALPNLTNDPVLSGTAKSLANPASIGGCQQTVTTTQGSTTKHIPDYRTCDISKSIPSGTLAGPTCQITHNYETAIVSMISSGGARGGVGAVSPGIATFGANVVWSGSFTASFTIKYPQAVQKVVLHHIAYCGWQSTSLDGTQLGSWAGVGPGSNMDLDTYPNIDVTSQVMSGNPVNIGLSVSYCGQGGNTNGADFYIYYDPSKIPYNESWTTNADCQNIQSFIQNGACTVSNPTCTSMPPVDGNGCVNGGDTIVCPNQFQPPPVNIGNISRACKTITEQTLCNLSAMGMTWTDSNGIAQSAPLDPSVTNTCGSLESNPSCGFISSKCLITDPSTGQCVTTTETWDCGTDQAVPTQTSTTSYDCGGQVACMGTDCTGVPATANNTSFGQALSMLQAVQSMATDGNCSSDSTTDCTVFTGQGLTCKKAVFGLVDCCNEPTQQSMGAYRDVQRLGSAEALRQLNLPALAGAPAADVFLTLMEFMCPAGGAVDEAIARQAMLEAIGDLAEAGQGSFETLGPAGLQEFFLDFVIRSIEGRVMADIGGRGITLPADVDSVERVQEQLHDYIAGCTRGALAGRLDGVERLNDRQVDALVSQIYEAAFELIAVAGEEEA